MDKIYIILGYEILVTLHSPSLTGIWLAQPYRIVNVHLCFSATLTVQKEKQVLMKSSSAFSDTSIWIWNVCETSKKSPS